MFLSCLTVQCTDCTVHCAFKLHCVPILYRDLLPARPVTDLVILPWWVVQVTCIITLLNIHSTVHDIQVFNYLATMEKSKWPCLKTAPRDNVNPLGVFTLFRGSTF